MGSGAVSTAAVEEIEAAGIPYRVVRYPRVDSIEEAAARRGVPIASIAKSLAIRRGEDDHILVLVGGDRALDWKKLRTVLGVSRLSLVDPADLVDITGYPRGAVTPFGTVVALPLFVDSRLAALDELSLGGGAFGTAIHLSGPDLVAYFSATATDLTKPLPGATSD